jgi:hypothetical protein
VARKEKKLRTQINGNFGDVVLMKTSNKNITLEPLFKNYKRPYIYSSIEDSEVVLGFERNDASLKKLSSFV